MRRKKVISRLSGELGGTKNKLVALVENADLVVDSKAYELVHEKLLTATSTAMHRNLEIRRANLRYVTPMWERKRLRANTFMSKRAAAAIARVNTLLASIDARCRIDPPPSPIRIETDAKGNLVQICGHSPPHRWAISQDRRP